MNKVMKGLRQRLIQGEIMVRNGLYQLKEEESGMGMVEIALIIVVLIGLAFIFQDQIESLLTSIFDKYNIDGL